MKTVKDILKLCEENGIEIIDFKITDIDGRWRHLAIPVSRFSEKTMKFGIGFDASNYGFAPVENSDMVFIPDLETAVIDEFCQYPTLSMMGDVLVIGKDNTRFDQYPRSVARKAMEYLKETGIADEMLIAPEFEFYVFDNVYYRTDAHSCMFTIDEMQSKWADSDFNNNGYQLTNTNGYHQIPPIDVNNDLRTQMSLDMEKWGIKVKYHHHEVGPGQQEIEVELGNMVEMADNTMITKYIVKNDAYNCGKTATFMPKPLVGAAGSGLHVHMLLKKDGETIFYDENGYSSLSKEALYFIGGICRHAASLCAITNPSTNSYKRLTPGFEAPVTIGYATANRSAVIRIPAYAKDKNDKRFELRNGDATNNPYYAYSAILMAGLDGIENKIDPHEEGYGPYDFNLYTLSEEDQKKIKGLPSSLAEAVDALEKDHEYLLKGSVFSERLVDLWIRKCRRDIATMNAIPNPKEFEMYYDM